MPTKIYKHAPRVASRAPHADTRETGCAGNAVEAARVRRALGFSDADTLTVVTLRDLLVGGFQHGFNTTVGALILEEELWDEALSLTSDADDSVAFRAAWALEWAYDTSPEAIEQRVDRLLTIYLTSPNGSVQRIFGKMLCDMTRRGTVSLDDVQALAVAERGFDLLTSPDVDVAVKVWQLELLHDLAPHIGWVAESLPDTIRTLSQSSDCSPAMAAATRRHLLGK